MRQVLICLAATEVAAAQWRLKLHFVGCVRKFLVAETIAGIMQPKRRKKISTIASVVDWDDLLELWCTSQVQQPNEKK